MLTLVYTVNRNKHTDMIKTSKHMKTYRATFKKEGMKEKSLFILVGREGTPEVSLHMLIC